MSSDPADGTGSLPTAMPPPPAPPCASSSAIPSRKHIEQICGGHARGRRSSTPGRSMLPKSCFAADIFCGHAKVPVDWDGVVRQGRLRWIQSSAAGMDHCLVPSVIASEITVTSALGVLADQVAEHTIALMTGWTREPADVFPRSRKRSSSAGPPDLTRAPSASSASAAVGRRLAELLGRFQCRILAIDLFPVDKPQHVESLWPAEDCRAAGRGRFLTLVRTAERFNARHDRAPQCQMKLGRAVGEHGPRAVVVHRRLVEELAADILPARSWT